MNADIDGSDITPYCLSKTWNPKLSRPASFTVRGQARRLVVNPGVSELHVYESGTLIFSGICTQPQASGDANTAYTEVTAYDHLRAVNWRMVKDSTGNLITPSFFSTDAPGMFFEMIQNTSTIDPGPFPLTVSSYAGGGIEVWFDLSSFPMQLEMMRAALVATGQMDIFLTPGIGSSTLDLTNGEGGADLSGSVSYEYLTGSHNAHVATITIDSDTVVNALWYLLAPRLSATRYKGSITRTAPHKGGTWPAPLLAKIFASQAAYGFHQRIDTKDEAGAGFYLRPFYEAQWASEANLIANPKTIASVLPNRGTFPPFKPGDLISVAAGTLQGGFSGAQRVYEFTLTEDADGALELTDIITSADQETGL